MYRLGKGSGKRRRYMTLFILIVAVIVALIFIAKQQFKGDTVVSKAPAVTSKVIVETPKTKVIDEPLFSFRLPTDWKFVSHQTKPFEVYTWQSTAPKIAGRAMSIYVDVLPTTMGVNHALPVHANGSHLAGIGSVSDNCADFTKPNPKAISVATPATWDSVGFLCDLGNNQRDVVGTASPDGINRVTLTGPNSGAHSLFFTYTDNDIQADYSIFVQALQSFLLK